MKDEVTVRRFALAIALAVCAAYSPATAQAAPADETKNTVEQLWKQGRYREAQVHLEEAVKLAEQEFGADAPQTADYLTKLGGLYTAQARYAEGEAALRRALAITEKVFGPDHPHVVPSLNNLGWLYLQQHRYAEAQPLLRRALAIFEKRAPSDPTLPVVLSSLATALSGLGREDEARAFMRRAEAVATLNALQRQ
jgi:tetratricopeptide (TPR) repeat protein